jgi:voltage-gated potassium channel
MCAPIVSAPAKWTYRAAQESDQVRGEERSVFQADRLSQRSLDRQQELEQRLGVVEGALRLLRLLRLMRIGHVAEAFATVTRVLQRKRTQLLVSLAVVLVAIFISAGALYVAEHGHAGTSFTSIPRAMWWSVITITTIGYGDMIPMTPIGKVLGGVVAFIGICAVALPVGIVSSGFIEELNRKPPATATPRTCPHCGEELEE